MYSSKPFWLPALRSWGRPLVLATLPALLLACQTTPEAAKPVTVQPGPSKPHVVSITGPDGKDVMPHTPAQEAEFRRIMDDTTLDSITRNGPYFHSQR